MKRKAPLPTLVFLLLAESLGHLDGLMEQVPPPSDELMLDHAVRCMNADRTDGLEWAIHSGGYVQLVQPSVQVPIALLQELSDIVQKLRPYIQ